jgi:type IV pilus assembly protein PilA
MLHQNLRAKIGARLNGDKEAGFTLIELLVVMLILGILAAIALPAFFNQRDKANDAEAKEVAHSAQVALETYATDNDGSYVGAEDEALLVAIEPTLTDATFTVTGLEGAGVPTANTYTITVTADTTTNTFAIENDAGALTYPCTGTAGCSGGFWD